MRWPAYSATRASIPSYRPQAYSSHGSELSSAATACVNCRQFTQAVAAELSSEPWLLYACGRYEGIDARVAEYAGQRMVVDEISLGDYVLCGGEVAVLVIMEAIAR